MQIIHKIVLWLDGKKALILAVAGPVINYLVASNKLTADQATLLSSVLSVLCGGALALGNTQGYKNYKLGAGK